MRWRVDAQRPQPHGVFVGAAGLAPAEKGVDEGLEQVRAAETLDHDPFIPDIEGLDRVASGMQNLAAGPELFGEELRETPQAFRGGIDVNAHDRKNLCCKVTPPGVTLLVLFDCEVVLKRKRVQNKSGSSDGTTAFDFELSPGLEPGTSSLPRKCSTTEL